MYISYREFPYIYFAANNNNLLWNIMYHILSSWLYNRESFFVRIATSRRTGQLLQRILLLNIILCRPKFSLATIILLTFCVSCVQYELSRIRYLYVYINSWDVTFFDKYRKSTNIDIEAFVRSVISCMRKKSTSEISYKIPDDHSKGSFAMRLKEASLVKYRERCEKRKSARWTNEVYSTS